MADTQQQIRIQRMPNGSLVAIPQIEVPDPTGLGKPTYRDDPNGQPYVVQVQGEPPPTSKTQPPVKVSPGQQLVNADGTVVYTAPGKPEAPAKPMRVSPGQVVLNPDGTVAYTAPPKADTPAQTASGQGRLLSGQGAADRGKGTLALDQAKIDAMTLGSYPALSAKLKYIAAMASNHQITPEQAAEMMAGETDQALNQAVTGLTAPQQLAGSHDQASVASSEANNRATNAASIYTGLAQTATEDAKAGSPFAADVYANRLAAAPQFQADMGGGPILTTAQKAQIGQNLLNGTISKEDALRQMAAFHGQNMANASKSGPFNPGLDIDVSSQPATRPALDPTLVGKAVGMGARIAGAFDPNAGAPVAVVAAPVATGPFQANPGTIPPAQPRVPTGPQFVSP